MVAGGELGLLWDEVAFFPQTAAFLPPPPHSGLFSPLLDALINVNIL